MAETRGAVVTALLLLCWRGAVPQPINMTSGAPTDMPPLSKAQEDSPGLFAKEGPPATPDELLVQEMLSANKSAVSEAQTTATALSTKFLKEKNLGLDEPFALGAGIAEGFRAPTEGPQFSVGGEDKILNSEPTMEDTFQMEDSSTFREPPFSSGKEEKDPKEGKFHPPGTGTPALPEGVAWGALVLGFLRG
ncbi:sperm acrosome-associated protein 7 [Erinaceus europaeus]|uniref:Sperm acrosome-associated protein 7 n=1 Tax=Erinaceus europaeus TaxID=9365 RepID=A0ABM3WTF5_ERIEU|nr:sperm acrosome-associated protein 7 [Erinaceus europaeus]